MTAPDPAAPRAGDAAADAALDFLPDFLRFAPAPGKTRHDGWSAGVQARFVLSLARGASVDEAAREVGRSRQSAYRLRDRAGAAGFAAAWDTALGLAQEARRVVSPLPPSPLEPLLVPRFYRGRLIGFTQRARPAGVMARLRELDRAADRLAAQRLAEAAAAASPQKRQR